MLYPIQNIHRNRMELDGIWHFQIDPYENGLASGWATGLPDSRPIAVPGSWNEQYSDLHDYFGLGWYFRNFTVPSGWKGQRIFIRVGSACYQANVFINGIEVGAHSGGHLPFAFEITSLIKWEHQNKLAIAVENHLLPTRVPSAGMGGGAEAASLSNGYPSTTYDFFPYAGIHRPVVLYSTPQDSIMDVTVKTTIINERAEIKLEVLASTGVSKGTIFWQGSDKPLELPLTFKDGFATLTFSLDAPHLWNPEDPFLYNLTVAIAGDSYSLKIGVRSVSVQNGQILLNGNPIHLKGFGRHEDFYASGKGLNLPLLVKDYALMKWCGANSYRTSHYPYSEEEMQMADQQGFLIIDEIPAVSLQFDNEENMACRMATCRTQIEELIRRDKNHPSVIMWSVANEPMPSDMMAQYTGQGIDQKMQNASKEFLRTLVEYARSLDSSRLVTLIGVMGGPTEWLEPCDVVCVNRYWGWYIQPGELDKGFKLFSQELDDLWELYQKPILVTEFGADTQPGLHSQVPVMWSEEYQAAFIRGYLQVALTKPFVAGMHVWNLADFAAVQSVMRVGGMNLKGVFTRAREPKMAVNVLRDFWTKPQEKNFPVLDIPQMMPLEEEARLSAPALEYMLEVAKRLNGKRPDFTKTIQLDFQQEGIYRLIFSQGVCRLEQGQGEADAGMRLKWQDALKLFAGKIDPMVAVMTGKIKTSGDARLLLILREML